ncbi:hypothetical protein GH714_032092 [Hevea brasiliensis]|uniref:Uncharacterized protein n=1 Tax=Hevea brasiliensis TaxID=3981 RepID=A0A6A6N9Q1_HEVBR|nr:hypothetical protein GH714_032092 [Hevea brasiliensis]
MNQSPGQNLKQYHKMMALALQTLTVSCQQLRQDRGNTSRGGTHWISLTKLVDIMLERLRCLKEDELSSLATIVATCGLNAALAEVESSKLHDDSAADYTSNFNIPRRMSSVGPGTMRYSNLEQMKRKQAAESESQHSSQLEKEIEEAKKNSGQTFEIAHKKPVNDSMEVIPDLGSVLIKHTAKLEKEVQQIRKNSEIVDGKELERAPGKVVGRGKEEILKSPALISF